MVLLCLPPLLPLFPLDRQLDGVRGRSGSAKDTPGDGLDTGVSFLDDMVDGVSIAVCYCYVGY